MSTYLAELTFRIWAIELAVSGVNYFVVMKRIYEPRVGELHAHQIGMSTRIVYIFVFAYILLARSLGYTTSETFVAGRSTGARSVQAGEIRAASHPRDKRLQTPPGSRCRHRRSDGRLTDATLARDDERALVDQLGPGTDA